MDNIKDWLWGALFMYLLINGISGIYGYFWGNSSVELGQNKQYISNTSSDRSYYDKVDTTISHNETIRYNEYEGFDGGYNRAEENDISDFEECQDQFGTSDEEDGCNEYVKQNHQGYKEFNGYECTEDCGGHEAGYERAEENGIDDEDDCGGNSQSFIEGCISYANGD